MNPDSIRDLTKQVIKFRDERDWKQFHSLRNLAISLAVEAGELLENFRWEDKASSRPIKEELADILYCLLAFCHEAKVDIGQELTKKLQQNAAKYPVDKARGSAKKYTELQ